MHHQQQHVTSNGVTLPTSDNAGVTGNFGLASNVAVTGDAVVNGNNAAPGPSGLGGTEQRESTKGTGDNFTRRTFLEPRSRRRPPSSSSRWKGLMNPPVLGTTRGGVGETIPLSSVRIPKHAQQDGVSFR